MSRKTKPSLSDEIEQLEERGSRCRYQLQHAGELLKMMADVMTQKHADGDDPDYPPWASAEYLADQIGVHVEELGSMLNALQLLGMRAGRSSTTPPLPASSAPLTVVGGTDGDAA